MSNQQKKLSAGFTMIEIIVAISITAIFVISASQLLVSLLKNPKSELTTMDSIDQARFVVRVFTNEIRAATYGTYPILTAGNYEVAFFTTVGAASNTINKVRYYLDGTVLYKGVTPPTAGTYNPANEAVTSVLSGVNNGASQVFSYYDGDYDGIEGTHPPLTQPVNINQIRFVKINLSLYKQGSSGATFNLSSGATIRSLKDNAGD